MTSVSALDSFFRNLADNNTLDVYQKILILEIFGRDVLMEAIGLIENTECRKYKDIYFYPDGHVLTFPNINFCTCETFKNDTMIKFESPFCKHLLACHIDSFLFAVKEGYVPPLEEVGYFNRMGLPKIKNFENLFDENCDSSSSYDTVKSHVSSDVAGSPLNAMENIFADKEEEEFENILSII
ncbi:hypothetical protein ROZALSC1DRAFT_21650 [Rozella allomycis CSF55]|uniref:SWIM-type domain-containing protein n=1 Tax=Rozella allomycis (strain CSF55) TaxID=988480 RepID=A0A4P9YKM8_ROZAC|nr:hypothetical protein ROZALSC1DRAFT_21650 [Rozella allomycis CSF55]